MRCWFAASEVQARSRAAPRGEAAARLTDAMAGADTAEDYAADVVRVVGAHTVRVARRDLQQDDFQDANFFDEDYSVAATTGFSVWEGARMLLDMLLDGVGDDQTVDRGVGGETCAEALSGLRGRRVLELGAGTGFAGLALAAAGCRVLLTDLPAVVEQSVVPNLAMNALEGVAGGDEGEEAGSGWAGEVAVGDGFAAAAAFDWTKPVTAEGMGNDPRRAEVLVAAEALWLRELVEPFVATVAACLAPRGGASHCLLAFRDRAGEASETFAGKAVVLEAFAAAGCAVRELAALASKEEPGRSVVLMRITATDYKPI